MTAGEEQDLSGADQAQFLPQACPVRQGGDLTYRFVGLDVSGGDEPVGIDAQLPKALSVMIGLTEDALDPVQHGGAEAAEKQIAGKGSVRKPGVDQDEGDALAAGDGQPVGPDFEFVEDDQDGPMDGDEAPDGEGEIDRRRQNRAVARLVQGVPVARRSGNGQHDTMVGVLPGQVVDQAQQAIDFADRNGVQPDTGSGSALFVGHKPGAQQAAVAAPGQIAHPEGKGQQTQQQVSGIVTGHDGTDYSTSGIFSP